MKVRTQSSIFLLFIGLLAVADLAKAAVVNHLAATNGYNFLIGDFNGDKIDDFVRQKKGGWAGDGQNTGEIFLSNGKCGFARSTLKSDFDLRGDLTHLFVGDFNGDGRDDILRREYGAWVANDRVNTAYLLLSDGKGGFSKTVLSEDFDLNGDLTNLYIGDFNGDGKDDVLRQEKGAWVADNNRINTAYLLVSTGPNFRKVVLSEDYNFNGDLTNLYIGDFNGDGKDDVLRQPKGKWVDQNSQLLLSTGKDTFTMIDIAKDFDLNGDLTALHIGDFNGDGKDDILRREKGAWATDNVNSAYLLLSVGDGRFQKIVLSEDFAIKADNTNVYVADINGDGKDDFFRQEKGDIAKDDVRTAEVYLSVGNNFRKVDFPEDQEMKGDISQLFMGDFNGDRKSDMIQYWGVDTNWVHYSQGDGSYL